MQTVARHLFLAIAVVLTTVIGSGGATAAMVDRTATAPPVAAVSPTNGAEVGIAHPVIIRFLADVTDRPRVEHTVRIGTDKPLPGRFSWNGPRELTWTPTGFLPTDSTVTVMVGERRTEFHTNAGVVADADMSTHTFTVSIAGQVVRTMPASMGKPGWETPVGTFPILEKFRYIVFDSRTIGIPLDAPEGYLIEGEWAERLTWGGVFVHSAPWSVDAQGNSNVSHGCINLAPDDAAWYYENVGVGDPVHVHW
ncbi:L,D-transpeptidase [Nocardia paucivorans]|uniref:L,D-transpeptidase n=1 Tax=Nocardia paucivorans TaxID=114259 RepID=UPI00030D0084|nr:L,D-transpeptidase [Nocardia paucivorans]